MLVEVTPENKSIFKNLYHSYESESAIYTQKAPDEKGLYTPDFKIQGSIKNWLIYKNDVLTGFAVIECKEPYEVLDYYIVPAQRRKTIGIESVKELFSLFKGNWIVKEPLESEKAVAFWNKVIKLISKGKCSESILYDKRWGRASIQTFNNSK